MTDKAPTPGSTFTDFEKKIWHEIRQGNLIDKAARAVVYELTREQRDDINKWVAMRDAFAYKYIAEHANDKDLVDLPHSEILKKFCEKFADSFVCARFGDYHDDYKTKNGASEPNEKTDTTHINTELYSKYFAGIDPLTLCYNVSSDAEGCVRAKYTHRVEAILAFCKLAAMQPMTSDNADNVASWVDQIEYFTKETHYMADNPNAHMRFDDN